MINKIKTPVKIVLLVFILPILISNCTRTIKSKKIMAPNEKSAPKSMELPMEFTAALDETLENFNKRKEVWINEKTIELGLIKSHKHHKFLKKLEWLIGEWEAEFENGKLYTKYSWDENKNYIILEAILSTSQGSEREGIEFISWDEKQGTIRSWAFPSSEGLSIPEERWTHKGNRWIAEGPVPSSGSLKSIYSNISPNSFIWEQQVYTEDKKTIQKIAPFINVRKN